MTTTTGMNALVLASLFFVCFAMVVIMLVASALGCGVDLGSLYIKTIFLINHSSVISEGYSQSSGTPVSDTAGRSVQAICSIYADSVQ